MSVKMRKIRLNLHQLLRRHLGRHGFAHPAAQGQQGDHEDENKPTHVLMILKFENSSKRGLFFEGCFFNQLAAGAWG